MRQTIINVGILSEPEISFSFSGSYSLFGSVTECNKDYNVRLSDGEILFDGKRYKELLFTATEENATFKLHGVTIGVAFHWERRSDQIFPGDLKIIMADRQLTAINIVSTEDYLISVISSEMSSTASPEFLKAHAVISRSWVLAQIEKNKSGKTTERTHSSGIRTDDSYIRWYDKEDHTLFDVCADDHCQRYQGFSHILSPAAKKAVKETTGEILVYEGAICDTRFSKCCGGVTEEFQYCWEPIQYPYLKASVDNMNEAKEELPDLTDEKNAEKRIRTSPDAFCNTSDKKILSQVLNDYDRETSDFYRWKVEYSQKELADLIFRRSGIDFGEIIDLIPVERGKSGRLVRLKIVGTKRTLIIGKELEIRRTLSASHLYSSAFTIDRSEFIDDIPQKFLLTGAGWGHGVGLCQIGAAVMGEKGYTYREILLHYFNGAKIEKRN